MRIAAWRDHRADGCWGVWPRRWFRSESVTGPGRTMPEAVVLDAYAVLAFLDDEPGAEAVAEVLRSGEPWMTLVNLGEVAYIVERERGVEAAEEV